MSGLVKSATSMLGLGGVPELGGSGGTQKTYTPGEVRADIAQISATTKAAEDKYYETSGPFGSKGQRPTTPFGIATSSIPWGPVSPKRQAEGVFRSKYGFTANIMTQALAQYDRENPQQQQAPTAKPGAAPVAVAAATPAKTVGEVGTLGVSSTRRPKRGRIDTLLSRFGGPAESLG